jgi:hypothetical protein
VPARTCGDPGGSGTNDGSGGSALDDSGGVAQPDQAQQPLGAASSAAANRSTGGRHSGGRGASAGAGAAKGRRSTASGIAPGGRRGTGAVVGTRKGRGRGASSSTDEGDTFAGAGGEESGVSCSDGDSGACSDDAGGVIRDQDRRRSSQGRAGGGGGRHNVDGTSADPIGSQAAGGRPTRRSKAAAGESRACGASAAGAGKDRRAPPWRARAPEPPSESGVEGSGGEDATAKSNGDVSVISPGALSHPGKGYVIPALGPQLFLALDCVWR